MTSDPQTHLKNHGRTRKTQKKLTKIAVLICYLLIKQSVLTIWLLPSQERHWCGTSWICTLARGCLTRWIHPAWAWPVGPAGHAFWGLDFYWLNNREEQGGTWFMSLISSRTVCFIKCCAYCCLRHPCALICRRLSDDSLGVLPGRGTVAKLLLEGLKKELVLLVCF